MRAKAQGEMTPATAQPAKKASAKKDADGNKLLPEDPNELDRVLAPYRIMVRPLVGGVSRVYERKLPPKLDADEIEGGTQAFSALLYQYGGALDARVLVVLWIVGTLLPRLLQYLEDREKKTAHTPDRLAAQIDAELAAVHEPAKAA